LTRHDLGNLSRLEVGNFNLASQNVHAGTRGIHRDTEVGSLHHRGKVRRFDLEMFDVALFHFEQDRAGLLHDGGGKTVLLFCG
jgi:hypothetical protein